MDSREEEEEEEEEDSPDIPQSATAPNAAAPNARQVTQWHLTRRVQAMMLRPKSTSEAITLHLRVKALPDNKEGVSDNGTDEDNGYAADNPIHGEARHALDAMLEDLKSHPEMTADANGNLRTDADRTLDLWNDREALRAACVRLGEKGKGKDLDVILCGRIAAMVGVLNLYLNAGLSYSWRNASLVVAKARGQGMTHARNLRKWILNFIQSDELPSSLWPSQWTVLDDEDISQSLQIQLLERTKCGYLKALDVVNIVSSPEMQWSQFDMLWTNHQHHYEVSEFRTLTIWL
ncbi:hypothetical protein EI94DRAFT_1814883 [Lactarius quietus]|nr:hypothetical protein EI94DRAFT_1814883 [Lactarius quietus]